MQAPPPSGLCPHLPATPSPTSCTPPVILLSLLWQREQAQLHLQLPQLSRRPAANPFHPELPFPFPSRPTPPRPHRPRLCGGGRARGRQLGAGDLTRHPNTGTLCNTHATLHTDPPVMPVRHGAWPRRSRCAWARAKSPPGTAGLWAVGLQATAGQRLRLEAGRALGPQARSLRALPHPTPRETDPEATAWRAGDRGGQCVCVCVRARGRGWAHVGACRKACGTRVHETLLSTRPHGSPVDSARGLGVGDLSPRTLTARGTCPCTPRPATGTRRRPRRARRGT